MVGAVVNWLRKSGRRLPERSLMSPVRATVIRLLTGKKLLMVTVRLSVERVIEGKKTRSPLANKATVLLLIVLASSDSEKVTMMRVPKGTSLVPSDGVIITTCGAVVSGVPPAVRNVLWK